MSRHEPHEPYERYRHACDPIERGRWQFHWLIARGLTATASASARVTLRLRVPDHVCLHFLPAYSPELQPAEHLWPLTYAPVINRHFASIEDVERTQAQCCVAQRWQAQQVR